jgi:N-acetylneuraminate synthase/sialic acid synthase
VPVVRALVIDGVRIDDDSDAYVIAEIGHNHQGDLHTALRLLRRAKEAGANAVKFQKRDNRSLFTRAIYDSPYENRNSYGPTYGAHREALEFGRDEYLELQKHATELGITMFATPFDFKSVDFLEALNVPLYKIASADLNNTPLLEYVARTGKPVIVSTGGGTMEDIQRAYDTIKPVNDELCLCQCTAVYPVEAKGMNLRVISTLRERFPDVTVGLSDHQNGIAMSLVAYVLGARVFEKHFTLSRAWKGTDHAFSLEPTGLAKMVRDLRRGRLSLGDGVKRRLEIEESTLRKMGKKLVAARDLEAGHVISREDVALKSPGDGLPPYELSNLVGRRLLRPLSADENIRLEDLHCGA